MRNQCDGCRAGRALVTLRGNHYWVDPTGTTHIMGPHTVAQDGRVITHGYPDLMVCCRRDYEVGHAKSR